MIVRLVFAGKTNQLTDIESAAKEIIPTAEKNWLGIAFPDDMIEAKVTNISEAKIMMNHIHSKTGRTPKYYTWTTGTSFWVDGKYHEDGCKYSDRIQWTDKKSEDLEDFSKFIDGLM